MPGTPVAGDVVFVGVVLAGPSTSPSSTDEPVAYTFSVEQVLRGDPAIPTATVWTAAASASCGATFTPGSRYVVVARRNRTWTSVAAGAMVTWLGAGNRLLPASGPVPPDALVWPDPPGFDRSRSNIAFRELQRFAPFPVGWLARPFGITRLWRARNRVTVSYSSGLRIVTTHLCRARGTRAAPPLARGPRRVRYSGVRNGRLVVFTGRNEIRFDGVSVARATAVASDLRRANGPTLPPPVRDAAVRVPCPVPRRPSAMS